MDDDFEALARDYGIEHVGGGVGSGYRASRDFEMDDFDRQLLEEEPYQYRHAAHNQADLFDEPQEHVLAKRLSLGGRGSCPPKSFNGGKATESMTGSRPAATGLNLSHYAYTPTNSSPARPAGGHGYAGVQSTPGCNESIQASWSKRRARPVGLSKNTYGNTSMPPAVPQPMVAVTKSSRTSAYATGPTTINGVRLRPVSELPDRFRSVFPFALFNGVQSTALDAIWASDNNVIISAPTGAGKTAIFELGVCRALSTSSGQSSSKMIYMAPTKALCSERKRDWDKKFRGLGITVGELTGDTDAGGLSAVKESDIIITTPEKWDSMTRRWQDHKRLMELVRLFMIDEVHMLKEKRGAVLEVVVSRMKTMGTSIRFVAVSATVPNVQDVAAWIRRSSFDSAPARVLAFGDEFRPVKLQKFVYGYPQKDKDSDFKWDTTLNWKLMPLIQKHSNNKPTIVFCNTRKAVLDSAKAIAKQFIEMRDKRQPTPWDAPAVSCSFRDKAIQELVKSGIAVHHAGLDTNDRALVEKLFLEGHISVVCCTSTLAVGVNLPAHLVIIKNTMQYVGSHFEEYPTLEIIQMLGRAGRPQFDDCGTAVIMTRSDKKSKYDNLVSGTETLESCLHENMLVHLNAEIGLGTIMDVSTAMEWLRSTFFYVRVRANPRYYNINTFGQDMEKGLEALCMKDLKLLEKTGMISMEGERLRSTGYGDASAKYYVMFNTMKAILEMKEAPALRTVLETLCQAEEFAELRLRQGDKGFYNELNKANGIKSLLKGKVETTAHKIFILVQVELGSVDISGLKEKFQQQITQMGLDRSFVFQHAYRICKCMIDCKLQTKDATAVKNALELSRCLRARCWEGTPMVLRQLRGIGENALKNLINHNIRSFEELETMDPRRIEVMFKRNPPFGTNILNDIAGIPKFGLKLQQTNFAGDGLKPSILSMNVEVSVLNKDNIKQKWHEINLYADFLAETADGVLLDFRRLPVSKINGSRSFVLTVELPKLASAIVCHLVCEDIAGTALKSELQLHIDASKFPTPAEPEVPKVANEDDYDEGAFDFDMDFEHIDNITNAILAGDTTNSQTGAPLRAPAATNSTAVVQTTEYDLVEPERLENGNYRCAHKCKDREKCLHMCCKTGTTKPIMKKVARTSSTMQISQPELTQSTLDHSSPAANPSAKRASRNGPSRLSYEVRVTDHDIIDLMDLPNEVTIGSEDVPRIRKALGVTTASSLNKLSNLHAKTNPSTRAQQRGPRSPLFLFSEGSQDDVLPENPILQAMHPKSPVREAPPPQLPKTPAHTRSEDALFGLLGSCVDFKSPFDAKSDEPASRGFGQSIPFALELEAPARKPAHDLHHTNLQNPAPIDMFAHAAAKSDRGNYKSHVPPMLDNFGGGRTNPGDFGGQASAEKKKRSFDDIFNDTAFTFGGFGGSGDLDGGNSAKKMRPW
ncbi:ATP-dependent DNA helicase MER3 [Saitoella coloradoensis]